jgi:hypothetical protein
VLLVGPPDAEAVSRLVGPFSPLTARRWLASAAEREHGIGQGGRFTAVFRTQCQPGAGGNVECVEVRCSVALGVPTAAGRCAAQAAGDRAVLEAERALCEAVRAPLSSRLVVESSLEQLAAITLREGGRSLSLRRSAEGGWQGPPDRADLTADVLAEALLGLAPLTAAGALAYGPLRAPALTVELRPAPRSTHAPPPITLLLATGEEGTSGLTRLARTDRPVIHRVPASLGAGLLRLLRGQ